MMHLFLFIACVTAVIALRLVQNSRANERTNRFLSADIQTVYFKSWEEFKHWLDLGITDFVHTVVKIDGESYIEVTFWDDRV